MSPARLAYISMTETLHFQRLVQFVVDAEELAAETDNGELRDLVEECRSDLLAIPREER